MTPPDSYEQQLKDAHKARQLKMALAAKALQARKALPIVGIPPRVTRVPELFLQHFQSPRIEEMWVAVRTSPLTVASLVEAAASLGEVHPKEVKSTIKHAR